MSVTIRNFYRTTFFTIMILSKNNILGFLSELLKSFNFVFAGVLVILTSFEFGYLRYAQRFEEGSNLKYNVLCFSILLIYSLVWGYSWNRGKAFFLYWLPTLMLPVTWILMEQINFSDILRFNFFSSLFHFFLLCIAWFLFWSFLIENIIGNDKIRSRCMLIQSFLEAFLLWLGISLAINALLNGGINEDAVVAMCQTDVKEAWHYFWGNNNGLLLVCGMAISLAILVFLIAKTRKSAVRSYPSVPKSMVFFKLGLVGLILLYCVIGWKANMYVHFRPRTWETIDAYNVYHDDIQRYLNSIDERQKMASNYAILSENTSVKAAGLYVFIIGESLNRNYMGCYVPERETTPFQKSLREQPGSVFFDKACACYVQTARAVPMMLTMYNQYLSESGRQFSKTETSLSILDIAKNSGYQVCWISNQEKISRSNSIITAIADIADPCVFTHMAGNYTVRYDMDLLPLLAEMEFAESSLVIIHLSGSHAPYGLNYPKQFTFPSESFSLYEKSVFYNDCVIRKLVEFFQERGAMLISYVSDHSEIPSHDHGHGHAHDPRPGKFRWEMIEIPMWFWASEEYREKNPELFARLQGCSGKVVTNDLVFNMLLDLMSFRYPEEIEEFSPLSSHYILDRVPAKTLDGQLEIVAR